MKRGLFILILGVVTLLLIVAATYDVPRRATQDEVNRGAAVYAFVPPNYLQARLVEFAGTNAAATTGVTNVVAGSNVTVQVSGQTATVNSIPRPRTVTQMDFVLNGAGSHTEYVASANGEDIRQTFFFNQDATAGDVYAVLFVDPTGGHNFTYSNLIGGTTRLLIDAHFNYQELTYSFNGGARYYFTNKTYGGANSVQVLSHTGQRTTY